MQLMRDLLGSTARCIVDYPRAIETPPRSDATPSLSLSQFGHHVGVLLVSPRANVRA
jgi:hypothetical protein